MKKLFSLLLVAALFVSVLTACGNSAAETKDNDSAAAEATPEAVETQTNENGITYPVEIENELGVTVIEDEVNAIAVFDLGMLDILDTLGYGDRVVAVTHGQSFPDYLTDYESDMYINLGGFKDWDAEALSDSNPDLIFAGFRQNKSIDTVTEIAPTLYFAEAGSDTSLLDSLEQRVNAITSLFGGEEEAKEYLEDIQEKVGAIQAYTADNEITFIVVTAENGAISLGGSGSGSAFLENDLGLISLYEDAGMGGEGKGGGGGRGDASQEAGLDGETAGLDGEVRGGLDESAEDVRGSDESGGDVRGQREEGGEGSGEQTAEAVAYILENAPDYVFVFDKDAAEAEEGQPSAQEIVEGTELADSEINIIYLDDTVWSSASGGLKATGLQLDMLMELFGLN